MDLDFLKKRLAVVQSHLEQTLANLNMLMGGKEELLYLIEEMERKSSQADVEVLENKQ